MHDSVLKWVRQTVHQHHLADRKTLELGSYDVNGSVRSFFTGDYIGIDLEDGPGVDEVMSAHSVGKKWPETFEVVVSTEMLEHDPAPWATMSAVKKTLVAGGHLLITARGNGFKPHNPPDHWRFRPSAFEILLDLAGCDVVTICEDPQVPGVFGHGVRRDH